MSEARKAADRLVARRPRVFASGWTMPESIARLASAVNAPGGERVRGAVDASGVRLHFSGPSGRGTRTTYVGRWMDEGGVRLDGAFEPARKTQRFLAAVSLGFTLLIAATAWSYLAADVDVAFRAGLTIMLGLAILGFPFLVVAFGSDREVEEIAIAKAIASALEKED